MARKEKLEVVRGTGNVFRDFGDPDADIRQTKAILAARIIGILDDRELSTRKAQSLTGVDQADFTRIRNAQLDRFTIDRLMTILNRFDQRVDIKVSVRPRRSASRDRQGAANTAL
jgi:predicted XRE-type DNA-binding protein